MSDKILEKRVEQIEQQIKGITNSCRHFDKQYYFNVFPDDANKCLVCSSIVRGSSIIRVGRKCEVAISTIGGERIKQNK